jgi:hypothetical protein
VMRIFLPSPAALVLAVAEVRRRSFVTSTAVPGVRARVASRCNLGQPAEVMGPAFCVAGALLGTGQARMG